MFTKEDMNGRRADLCRDCHSYLHKKFTHAELAKLYNTVELIMENEKIQKHIVWLKKQRKVKKTKQ
jgi:hypothetical protein